MSIIKRIKLASAEIKSYIENDFTNKDSGYCYMARCQCCGSKFKTDYPNGIDDVCPKCGWEQQYATLDYTGQNPLGCKMYRKLYYMHKNKFERKLKK